MVEAVQGVLSEIVHWAPLSILAVALLVSACAGSLPGISQQGKAGITEVHLQFGDDGKLKGVDWVDGKEKANITLDADILNGVVKYAASDVKAFDGQAIRSAVEQEVAKQIGDVAPGAIQAITDAVIKTLVPTPVP